MLQRKVDLHHIACPLNRKLGAALAHAGSQAALQLSLLHGLVGIGFGYHDNISSHLRLEGTFPKASLHLCVLGRLSCLGEGGGEPLSPGISPSSPDDRNGLGNCVAMAATSLVPPFKESLAQGICLVLPTASQQGTALS